MVAKIISGGQTGADRGGLDFAIKHGIPHGGWCPKFRMAKDGTVPLRYNLRETASPGYPDRTKLNVRDSDGTVIFTTDPPGRGSAMTIQHCLDLAKPYVVFTSALMLDDAGVQLFNFLRRNQIRTLNVAGSREESFHTLAQLILQRALAESEERWPKTLKTS